MMANDLLVLKQKRVYSRGPGSISLFIQSRRLCWSADFWRRANFSPTNGRKQKWIASAIEPWETLGCRDEAMFPLRQGIGISDSLPEVLEPFKPLVGRSHASALDVVRTLSGRLVSRLQHVNVPPLPSFTASLRNNQVYRCHDLFDQRRKLMEAWAAHCAAPKAGKVMMPNHVRFAPKANESSHRQQNDVMGQS